MMSLDAIHSLPVHALHDMIAAHCLEWERLSSRQRAQTGCTHRAPDGGLHTVPAYTEDWAALMPLVLSAGVSQAYFSDHQEWLLGHRDARKSSVVVPSGDEALHRRRLAELVLWVAMQGEAGQRSTLTPDDMAWAQAEASRRGMVREEGP